MLGAILAVLSAATFALNNVMARRGVVTGTPTQGVAVTVPIGVLCFLPAAILTGSAGLAHFPPAAAPWMAGVGLLHFLVGRYCNFRANQAAGVNLTAPVIQLQVVVTLVLAVLVLHEPLTVLQLIGATIMLAGALITQRQAQRSALNPAKNATTARSAPLSPDIVETLKFTPRYAAGYLFASLAALAYGTTPIMARAALRETDPLTGIIGGLIAYAAATAAIAVGMWSAPLRRDLMALSRENVRWFVCSGVFVAVAQGLFFAALTIAPIMLIVPLMQLSLAFRLTFATLLNADYELFGWLVIAGTITSIAGACAVSIDSGVILAALAVPEELARLLRSRV